MSSVRLGCLSHRPCMAAFAVALCLSAHAAADIVIDDFTSVGAPNPWPAGQSAPGNNLITEVSLANVLGNVRQTTVFGQSFESGGDLVTVSIAAGRLSYASSGGADGAMGLFYTGFPAGLGLNMTNELGVQLDFAAFGFVGRGDGEGGSANVTVDIFDGSQNANMSQMIGGFGPQSMVFNLTEFSNVGSLDLSHINRITVSIDPLGSDVDFELDRIFTITIPSPGAIAALAVAGLLSSRRRRQR